MYWLLWTQFAAIPTQQAPSLQIHPQTHLDLRHPTLGHSIHIQREILESFQSKTLHIIVDAPWYVPNNHICRDLQMTSVKEESRRCNNQYSVRLSTHTNDQILTLMELPGNRRLRRHVPNDLPDRFLV
jgi:hypothetical protein